MISEIVTGAIDVRNVDIPDYKIVDDNEESSDDEDLDDESEDLDDESLDEEV